MPAGSQRDRQILLSPSDVAAYQACRHPTTLELEAGHLDLLIRMRDPLKRLVVTGPSQPEPLPFARYRGGGRTLLQPPPMGDGTSRHGYGVPVFAECGSACTYCGRDLGSAYDSWLDLFTACRSCNEFLNGYRVTDPAPADLAGFCESRDRHFLFKREWVMARHGRERQKYEAWRAASAPAQEPADSDILRSSGRVPIMRRWRTPRPRS